MHKKQYQPKVTNNNSKTRPINAHGSHRTHRLPGSNVRCAIRTHNCSNQWQSESPPCICDKKLQMTEDEAKGN